MSESTRTRLMDAAERLFAEQGVKGVTFRELTDTAGVNVASAHYHFGSKEALLDEVLLRRLGELAARRAELTRELAASPPSIESWVRLLVTPLLELIEEKGEQGQAYIKLHWRCQSDFPGKIEMLAREGVGEVSHAFTERLLASLPKADPEQLQNRARVASRMAFDVLAGNVPVPMSVEQLCDFLACGLAGNRKAG